MIARLMAGFVISWCMSSASAPACLIVLHSPDGHHFSVRADAIEAIRPIEPSQHDHLAPHTNSVVFFGGKNHGVRETEERVISLRMKCRQATSP